VRLRLRLAVVQALRGFGEVCERLLDVRFVSRELGLPRPQGFLGGGEPRLRRFGGCEAALEFLRIGSRALVECLERSVSADDLLLRSREIARVLRLGLRGRLDCFLVGRQLIRGFVHRLLSTVQFASPLREAGLGRLQGGFFRGHVFRSGVQDRLASLQVCFRTTQLRLFRAKFRFPQAEDRKSTRLNSSHEWISYAVFCLKKKIFSNIYLVIAVGIAPGTVEAKV